MKDLDTAIRDLALTDGAVRPLPAPQPLQGCWEAAATHEYWDEWSGTWQPAVVETLAGRAYVVPPMQLYLEDAD